jgi:hypothetical protein
MRKKVWFFILCFGLNLSPFITPDLNAYTIPEDIMDSCVFIMQDNKAIGTGFLIGVKEQKDTGFCYLVTAKHVMQPALKNIGVIRLRINRKDGSGAEIVEFPMIGFDGKPWIEHTNPAVDLAVAPLAIFDKIDKYKVRMYPLASATDDFLATQEFINRFKIRPGDGVFTLGLVPYLFSMDSENIIMTRSGTISMIGTRELSLPGGKQKAHFLDCPAFGGQSGGPAFVLLDRDDKGNPYFGGGRKIALLGVVTEFIPSPLRIGEMKLTEKEEKKIIVLMENTGISKVVPVDYLIDILFSPSQQDFRKKVMEEKTKSSNKP